MAKKTKSTSDKPNRSTKDRKTLGSIRDLADTVVQSAGRGREPYVDIPSRSLSNVRFNQSKRIIEMGSGTNRRELFNLAQARSYMQTLLVASGCKQLIDQGKTTSIRGLFYLLKHTIEGTSEETFDTQNECDPVIEDIEVSLDSMREELHLYAKNAGAMVGPITLVDSGDTIDCSRMGSGGYSIPSIVEQDIVQFKKNTAKFILHHELKLPVYCLLDNDPWGYYIYSVIKQGSINLAYESRRMAIPDARFLGLRSLDYGRCQLSPSVQIKLNEQDIKRARQIAQYTWFVNKKPWQKEIELMLKNGFKLEVEALISKDISYVTEQYVPARLKEGEFLD